MDCWIASFPRSGNTFFRNILYYVYGIESSSWHKGMPYRVDSNYDQYRFVKTHLLPDELNPDNPSIPAIYIVRDGRDALVSIAHHRKDIVKPGSDFYQNLEEAIVAAGGSFFGGWSRNVNEWLQRCHLVIRYEDLIKDPAKTFNAVEKIISLPSPNWKNLPTFEEMKAGKVKYGSGTKRDDLKLKPLEFAGKFFRKGKSGGWNEEMPDYIKDLFWNYHGDMMEKLGYETYKGSVTQNPLLDFNVMKKMGLEIPTTSNRRVRICIEATKLVETAGDGIKRYVTHLLKCLEDIQKNGEPKWEFKLLVARKTYELANFEVNIRAEEVEKFHFYEIVLLKCKKYTKIILPAKFYKLISDSYKKTNARNLLKIIREKVSAKPLKSFQHELDSFKNEIDIFHIPLPQNSEDFKTIEHNFIVTVHDLTHKLFPDFHESINTGYAETGMQFILDKNADVIAVSKSTANDLEQNYNISKEKTHLVYEGPDQNIFRWNVNKNLAENIRTKYRIGSDPYFLCLSTIEPRKNLPNTIRAFNKLIEENPDLKINLVVSGNFGWKTEHISNELHLENKKIIFTGFIEDHDLHIIYSEAISLCYLSFYEGFGLPPLEAMSCRTPVIYGNNSSMIEIIGDCGLPADVNNIDNIKDQMSKMYFDKNLRNELAIKSHHRSFEFSGRRFIFETLKVYEAVADKIFTQQDDLAK